MRVPLAVVMAQPDHYTRLQLAFMSQEPPAIEQLVLGVAMLTALVDNRSRGSGGSEPAKVTDYLPFASAWKREEGPAQSTVTSEELQMLSHLSQSRPA